MMAKSMNGHEDDDVGDGERTTNIAKVGGGARRVVAAPLFLLLWKTPIIASHAMPPPVLSRFPKSAQYHIHFRCKISEQQGHNAVSF